VRWTAAGDLHGDDAKGVCPYVVGSGALDKGVARGRATQRAWACQCMAPTWLHACTGRATPESRRRAFGRVSSASGPGGVRLHRRAPGAASRLEQRRAAAEQWRSGVARRLKAVGEHVGLLVARGGDGWLARRREFGW
jgi:hypothetical protein